MKKLLILAVLCLASTFAFSQENYIRDGLTSNVIVGTNADGSSAVKSKINYERLTIDGRYYAYNATNNFIVPRPILERYMKGRAMYRGGAITLSLGCVFSFIGGCMFASRSVAVNRAGLAFDIIGASAISVGIPLMCFGSHIKKESNHEYEMLKEGYYLAPLPAAAQSQSTDESATELPTPDTK